MSKNDDISEAEFYQQAEETQTGLLREFWDFIRYNKKWWLTPVIVVLLLAAAFVLLSSTLLASTAAGPFVYTLF